MLAWPMVQFHNGVELALTHSDVSPCVGESAAEADTSLADE